MRGLLVPIAALAVASVLWPLGVPKAHACSCINATTQQAVHLSAVILVGAPVSFGKTPSRLVKEGDVYYQYGERPQATIHVDRYLKGRGPSTVDVVDDSCVGAIASDHVGEAHLLILLLGDNELMVSGCLGSGPVSMTRGPNCLGPTTPPTPKECIERMTVTNPLLAEVEAITGPGVPPDDTLPRAGPPDTAFPYVLIAIAAALAPAAFLALRAAHEWGRREGAG